jgi:hypothetical protein
MLGSKSELALFPSFLSGIVAEHSSHVSVSVVFQFEIEGEKRYDFYIFLVDSDHILNEIHGLFYFFINLLRFLKQIIFINASDEG